MTLDNRAIRIEFEYIRTQGHVWRHDVSRLPTTMRNHALDLQLYAKVSNYAQSFFTLYDAAVNFTKDFTKSGNQVSINIAEFLDSVVRWYAARDGYAQALEATNLSDPR
jgi:hypothetical protein